MDPVCSSSSNGSGSAGGSRRPLTGRVSAALVAMAATTVAALGLASAPALADSCPNAAVRAENNSTALPDCRAWELVSSSFKEGFSALAQIYTDDGNTFAYQSSGNFADNGLGGSDNQYLAQRSPAGWSTLAQAPSGPTYEIDGGAGASTSSADLRSSLWLMRRADESTDVADFYLRKPDGSFTRIGPGSDVIDPLPQSPGSDTTAIAPVLAGVSQDLSHVVFAAHDPSFDFPGAPPGSLYEYVGTGNTRPRLVGVDDAGQPVSHCGTLAGSQQGASGTVHHAVSADGSTIFFSALPCAGGPPATEVWARVNGETSYDASASRCTRTAADAGGVCDDPADATFVGAAADGSRVFFTSTQQLVNGDTDATEDLYAYDLPSAADPDGDLTEVSGAASDANVEGPVRLFQRRHADVLRGNRNPRHQPRRQ